MSELATAFRDIAVERGIPAVDRKSLAMRLGVSTTHITRLIKAEGAKGVRAYREVAFRTARAAEDWPMIARMVQFGCQLTAAEAKIARDRHPDLCNSYELRSVYGAAARLIAERGFAGVSRAEIAEASGVCPASVSNAFGGLSHMADKLMTWAIQQEDAKMVARGLQIGNAIAKSAPESLRRAAAEYLI
ncbi:MAG: TetR family transcriptional regulator [Plesiomonas shigelloides]